MGAGTNTDPSRCLPKTCPRSCNPAWIQALRLDLFTPGVGPTARAHAMYGLTFIQCCVVYLQPWIAGDEAGAPTTSSTTL
jgi:hypothetical protein